MTGGQNPPTGKKALSRELADFLIEFSIALHKHAMYPEGHPSLVPAAGAVAQRLGLLLDKQERLSLGVARQQLVIEGVATDPKHPVLRDLANRMHTHHVGAVTFYRGVDFPEINELLRAMSVEPETDQETLGIGGRDLASAWPHVRLHRLAYGELELVDLERVPDEPEHEQGTGTHSAELWVGLARAALAIQEATEEVPTTEPTEVARAIDQHPRGAAYDQVIVGYLLQIAEELKAAGGADAMALRRRVSKLVGSLEPDTLERLVEMGGDFTQRKKFVLDATYGMAVDAVMDVVQAAAATSQQTVSHSLVRILSKLASHADHGSGGVRPHADRALREQVRQLITTWELEDPNPSEYGEALDRLSKTGPLFAVAAVPAERAEPFRMLQMCLEIDATGPHLDEAVDTLLADERLRPLLDLLDEAEQGEAAEAIWRRVATVERLETVLEAEPVDQTILERLVPRMGLTAAAPMLDALARAESQSTRRKLLSLLSGLGPGVGAAVVERLDDGRWYVIRNLLALLALLPELPRGFSAARFRNHSEPRVRREAVKLQLRDPEERDHAICASLTDTDHRVLRIALGAVQEQCPSAAVSLIIARANDRELASDLRVLAIRALAGVRSPLALQALLGTAVSGRTILGRLRLAPKSPELVAAITALRRGWRGDAKAAAVIRRAASSSDGDIRAAAGGAGE